MCMSYYPLCCLCMPVSHMFSCSQTPSGHCSEGVELQLKILKVADAWDCTQVYEEIHDALESSVGFHPMYQLRCTQQYNFKSWIVQPITHILRHSETCFWQCHKIGMFCIILGIDITDLDFESDYIPSSLTLAILQGFQIQKEQLTKFANHVNAFLGCHQKQGLPPPGMCSKHESCLAAEGTLRQTRWPSRV
jgi:hypothetical protein